VAGIKPGDLKSTIYVSGGFTGAGAVTAHPDGSRSTAPHAGAPILKDTSGTSYNPQAGVIPADPVMSVDPTKRVTFRISGTPEVRSGGKLVSFDPPSATPPWAMYLPFAENVISSVRLPGSGAGNIDYCFTAELSGCSFWIDELTGSNDLVVYHANGLEAGKRQASMSSTITDQLAKSYMVGLHTKAHGVNARTLGTLVNRASLFKETYLQCVKDWVAHKRAAGRTDVVASPGTNVIGFRIGGQWQFWWQTWALVAYKRPADKKNPLKDKEVKLQYGTGVVLGAGQFYP